MVLAQRTALFRDLIRPWSEAVLMAVFGESLDCRPEELKLFESLMVGIGEDLISPRPRLVIFEVDHLPKLGLEWVICLIYLSFQMRFDCFRDKNS